VKAFLVIIAILSVVFILETRSNTGNTPFASTSSDHQEEFDDIADFDAEFTVHGNNRYFRGRDMGYTDTDWELKLTWRKLFSLLAPYLIDHPIDSNVKSKLADIIADHAKVREGSRTIDDQEYKTITIQLKALGLVNVNYTKTTQGGMGLFWSLTVVGERVMMKERTVKK
jgi:hypothetical protein